MKDKKFQKIVEIPEGVSVEYKDKVINITGEKGTVSRNINFTKIKLSLKDNKIIFDVDAPTKKEKALIFTMNAHLKNMFKGVKEGHTYKLKICASHFPMNVSINNNVFEVKNFIGEKVPRTLKIRDNVEVKISGDIITVSSIDKESAGVTASDIEQLTRRPGFDSRRFQDGIYITEKDGKKL